MEFVESQLTSKYQVTLPKKVRQALGITKKTHVVFLIEDRDVRVIIKPADLMRAMDQLAQGTKTPNILADLKKDRTQW